MLRVIAAALLALTLVACSSSKKNDTTTTTTVASTATTSTSTPPTSVATTTTTATTVPKATTTTAQTASVRIVSFTGPNKVDCNAPTSVELKWATTGATKVVLSIDGRTAATFTKPNFDGLQYFPCDGKPHRYTIVATAGSGGSSASATQTITISS